MNELMTKVSGELEKKGYTVVHAATKEEAAAKVLALTADAASVACGGSVTIRDLGVAEQLKEQGKKIWWHWMPEADLRTVFLNSLDADYYLASANAVTASGQIVNIDATGNRVGALAYGPKKVILVIGSNKLVDGGVPQAIARIKKEACPPNARRLNRDTYCAVHNVCNVAECNNSMCRVTEIIDLPPASHQVTIILVEEAIGY